MIQGYIIQFYHPIETELPQDIRDDWMQWHHEELIRDNKVFETVQLKLDIQNYILKDYFICNYLADGGRKMIVPSQD